MISRIIIASICLLFWIVFDCLQSIRIDDFAPHARGKLPWFEGWYTRVQSPNRSFAIVIGQYPQQTLEDAAAICFLLDWDASDQRLSYYPLSFDSLNVSSTALTVVSADSETQDFSLSGRTGDGNSCTFKVAGNALHVNFHHGSVHTTLTAPLNKGDILPWGPHIPAPEAWLRFAPPIVKLHWYVHSLRTPVHYTVNTSDLNHTGRGVAHLEKNWGPGFPSRWLWVEGQLMNDSRQPGRQASLVLAGGHMPTVFDALLAGFGVDLTMFVLSYRSDNVSVSVDPWNPPLRQEVMLSPCEGKAHVKLVTLLHTVVVDVQTDPSTFQAVPCPTNTGFTDDSVESFAATIDVQVLPGLLSWAASAVTGGAVQQPLDTARFEGSALEFGGSFRCPDSKACCPPRQQLDLLLPLDAVSS